MKSTKKIIICAVLALCLIFTTSCSYTLGLLINNGSGAGTAGGQNDTPPQTNQQGGSNAGGTSDTQTGGGSSDSSEPKFHPDANDPAVPDTLDPATRTLLSTVAIDARLDLRTSYPYYDDYYYGDYYYESDTTTEYTSYGSGVIYSIDREAGDAYIITNFHVVYNKDEVNANGFSDTISLYLYGMEEDQYAISATVVGGSMTYDLAVLRVEGSEVLKNSMATAAALGNSEEVRVLDDVLVVGNPEGYGISVTEGIISVESEPLSITGADGRTGITLRVMRTSAAINDGNSGGGLYDTDGRLVGVVCAKRMGADVDNIGYAIPVNLAKALADNILRNCDGKSNLSIKKCAIGIELAVASSGLVPDGKGNLVICEEVRVDKLLANSLVDDKIRVGDIITAITVDGVKTEVTRKYHVIDAMLAANVGSTVTVTATRDGTTFDTTVTIPETAVNTVK